jgi:hypothetical protein
MAKKFEFEGLLINGPQYGVYIEFPFDTKKEFGTRKAIRVKVSFDGKNYDATLLPRENETHWMRVRKEIRLELGKTEGETILVSLEKDENKRNVQIPDYLQWLFENDPEAGKAFQKLGYFYKNFWVASIEETKNEETKVERINKLFEFLRSKR